MIYYVTRISDGEMFVAIETDGNYSVVWDSEGRVFNEKIREWGTEVDDEIKNSVVLAIESSDTQTEYDITKGEE